MYKKQGTIFNIQRFSTSDGPGIRTVIFFKGCPLRCVWCHNPESQSKMPEVFFKNDLCISCGNCEKVCPQGNHDFSGDTHIYHRETCSSCGICSTQCFTNALELCGKSESIDKIVKDVLRDFPFYQSSNGGVTLSGGEPLMQFEFTLELAKALKNNGIHTAIETCGYTTREITLLHPYIDLWLYDIKVLDPVLHQKYTRVTNQIILNNLSKLDDIGANIFLRCPIIPNINLHHEHLTKIAQLGNTLSHVSAIQLETYHPLGISKAHQLGKIQPYDHPTFLSTNELIHMVKEMQKLTTIPITIL